MMNNQEWYTEITKLLVSFGELMGELAYGVVLCNCHPNSEYADNARKQIENGVRVFTDEVEGIYTVFYNART